MRKEAPNLGYLGTGLLFKGETTGVDKERGRVLNDFRACLVYKRQINGGPATAKITLLFLFPVLPKAPFFCAMRHLSRVCFIPS